MIFINFAVSAPIASILQQPVPLSPPSFTPKFITVILLTTAFLCLK